MNIRSEGTDTSVEYVAIMMIHSLIKQHVPNKLHWSLSGRKKRNTRLTKM